MDQYGKSDWVPCCVLAWTFQMHSRNNIEVWILNKGTQILCNYLFILHYLIPIKKIALH
jgi:hypothetical protein